MFSQARQGDVFLIKVDALPLGAIPIPPESGRIILAHGEATGHAHAFSANDRVAFYGLVGSPDRWVTIAAGTAPEPLIHEEHGPIPHTEGVYKVRRQVEYVPGELPRQVID